MLRSQLAGMLAVLLSLVLAPLPGQAQDKTEESVKVDVQKSEKDKEPAPTEKAVTTSHSAQIGGRSIAYKATAGTLIIRDDKGKPDASVFYVAYTADGEKSTTRPVTFLYNGGPGSASIWLHMGSFAPVRIVTASPDATAPAPYQLVANADSLLDKSDLVFVDAIGTGFSKGLVKADASKDAREQAREKEENQNKRFWGTDQDIDAFGRFITRYITVNKRWNSPKFLFGESYGTPRSAGLSKYLEEHGIALNGVVLLSSILNYGSRLPALDNDYINLLPSYAAIAWYHNKTANRPATLEPYLTEVRNFARGDYAVALNKGQDLTAAERDAIAERMAKYTGLSAAYLKEANLRVSQPRFRKELLRDERRTLGRYDGRFEGIDMDAAGETPETDPADTAIRGAFTAAFNDYIVRELNYSSDVPYATSAGARADHGHGSG